jgi:hypothetical protein
MGMAPPHVEEGDLACVLTGAQVPFLLRKGNGFCILVGEVYISDGYMYGRAIDEMEAGRLQVQESRFDESGRMTGFLGGVLS